MAVVKRGFIGAASSLLCSWEVLEPIWILKDQHANQLENTQILGDELPQLQREVRLFSLFFHESAL
jgi:hypothetical protein